VVLRRLNLSQVVDSCLYIVVCVVHVQVLLEVERSRDMSIQMNTKTSINNSSWLPVRCDDSQQYPRKLSIKKISKIFY
jgi:hypothetical protein